MLATPRLPRSVTLQPAASFESDDGKEGSEDGGSSPVAQGASNGAETSDAADDDDDDDDDDDSSEDGEEGSGSDSGDDAPVPAKSGGIAAAGAAKVAVPRPGAVGGAGGKPVRMPSKSQSWSSKRQLGNGRGPPGDTTGYGSWWSSDVSNMDESVGMPPASVSAKTCSGTCCLLRRVLELRVLMLLIILGVASPSPLVRMQSLLRLCH